jgi:hypothetical protein
MREFFIDTADSEYIKATSSKLFTEFIPTELRGIIAHPVSFAKLNIISLSTWKEKTNDLCRLLTSYRGPGGAVYVSLPSSAMSSQAIIDWAKRIVEWGDGTTIVGLEIPPFKSALDVVYELFEITEISVNGVTDCGTALMALTHGVRYINMIPGVIESQGVDAKAHIAYLQQRPSDNSDIIASGIKTLDSLKWVCQYGAIPAMNVPLLDKAIDHLSDFSQFWKKQFVSDIRFVLKLVAYKRF